MKTPHRHPRAPADEPSPWIVRLDRVRDAPVPLDREIAESDVARMLAVEPPTLFSAGAPARLTARVQRTGERAFVIDGRLETSCRTECRRCLAAVDVPARAQLHLELVPAEELERAEELPEEGEADDDGKGERSGSFALDDADRVPIDGQSADLFALLQEQLLLALPTDALCTEECRGLCQICGQNLNERECGCERKIPDPRWASLGKLKI